MSSPTSARVAERPETVAAASPSSSEAELGDSSASDADNEDSTPDDNRLKHHFVHDAHLRHHEHHEEHRYLCGGAGVVNDYVFGHSRYYFLCFSCHYSTNACLFLSLFD